MVVDDSLTVRKISGRLLARHGYHVLTAKDGVDALEQLVDVMPDVMLLDIEMPRMDGFDLARNIRNDKRLRHIPIIMITSRTADKHRQHAEEIGVNHYMGKPYDEDELLARIRECLEKHPDARGARGRSRTSQPERKHDSESAARPFKVLGIQQIAIGGPSKDRLKKLWVEMFGLTADRQLRQRTRKRR
jgi:DNA-binding response OmpR family regulator